MSLKTPQDCTSGSNTGPRGGLIVLPVMDLDSAGGAVTHTRLGLSSGSSCSSVSQCLLECGALRVKTSPSPERSAATAPWSVSPSSGSAGHRWTASCPSGWDRTLRGHFELCLQSRHSLPGSGGSADSWCTVVVMRKHEIRSHCRTAWRILKDTYCASV